MAAAAARKALEDSGLRAEDIGLLIVATISADTETPSTACRVQAELGASGALAFDINAACSGFLYAVHIADAFIKSGCCRNALIVGAETLSKLVDWTDRSTCILFGDGAGAAVLQASEKGGVLSCLRGLPPLPLSGQSDTGQHQILHRHSSRHKNGRGQNDHGNDPRFFQHESVLLFKVAG